MQLFPDTDLNKSRLGKYVFFSLTLVIVGLEFHLLNQGLWEGDYWEHAAVVKELSKNLVHPLHPLFDIDLSHAFYTPYAFMLALVMKMTNINVQQVLYGASLFNLALLIFGTYYFCKKVFVHHSYWIATIALLFILLLWPQDPIGWSGFIHFYVLHKVLPYPATFAIALSLIIISLVFSSEKLSNRILIALLSSIVFISHPTTAVFLFIAVFSYQLFYSSGSLSKRALHYFLFFIAVLGLSLLWPYYKFYQLYDANVSDFHADSSFLYLDFLRKHWIVLVACVLSIILYKKKEIRFLGAILLLLLTVFKLGEMLELQGFGRLVSTAMIMSQFIIAGSSIYFFKYWNNKGTVAISIVLLGITLLLNRHNLKQTFLSNSTQRAFPYQQLQVLHTQVAEYDVILSDETTNWHIPAFNGKVISSWHPVYWIGNLNKRRQAIKDFFEEDVNDQYRLDVLKVYNVNYVLLKEGQLGKQSLAWDWCKENLEVHFSNNALIIYKVK